MSILRSKMADQKVFRSNGNIGFWFQRGLSFPKMYLVTTLHKSRAKIHSNPDYTVHIWILHILTTVNTPRSGGITVNTPVHIPYTDYNTSQNFKGNLHRSPQSASLSFANDRSRNIPALLIMISGGKNQLSVTRV